MWYVTVWRLMWEMWTAQCTRCGGNHALSRCTWPLVARSKSEIN